MHCKWNGVLLTGALLLAAVVVSAAGAAPGDLDPSFGSGGKVTTDFGGGADEARAIAFQADGKFVVAGENNPVGPQLDDFALARYTPDGALDLSFGGGDGRVTTDFGRFDSVHALVVQPDGKIVAAGSTSMGPPLPVGDFALARYTQDGILDSSFDGDGTVTTDFGGTFDVALDLILQADGKLVVVGQASNDAALARYTGDGSLDTGFGVGGKVITDFGFGGTDVALGVAQQADGRIVTAGRTGNAAGDVADAALARYLPDGMLDSTFDGDGKVTVDFDGGADFATDLAIHADRTIVAAGGTDPPGPAPTDFALARLNPDGSLYASGLDPYMDPPFGSGGKVTTDFSGAADAANAVAIEPGGRLVVIGDTGGGADFAFALARYNVDGSLDSGFGASGKVTTDFSAGMDRAFDVALQRDGAILVAGSAAMSSVAADFALARYVTAPCCLVEGAVPGAGPGRGHGSRPSLPGPPPTR